jgi:hypothetical protein
LLYNDYTYPHFHAFGLRQKGDNMKPPRLSVVIVLLTLAVLLAFGGATSVRAQEPVPQATDGLTTPAITYQGQLKMSGGPVTGTCDFSFGLFGQQVGGSYIGGYDYVYAEPVSNGLFTVTLNAGGEFNPSGNSAFQGDLRYLDIWVRCPAAASGAFTELTPRQLITAVPYALTLVPGAQGSRVNGSAYQLLKVTNSTTATGNPAAVTGEISASLSGVGVYGGNTVATAGATGMGVWGRTSSPAGSGVRATGLNGASGVYAESTLGKGVYAGSGGTTITNPALLAENTSTKATEPAGIAIYALNHSADVTLLLHNTGAGYLIRAFSQAGGCCVYSVNGAGHVFSTLMTTTGGSDLAEQFTVSTAAAPEPGTLMVIDAAHPGQLKPSDTAYDTKVAGVVSGAGGLQPGMTLAQQDSSPIAIAGRVYVKAEANSAPIKPGDLLTSSALPGYAMKAVDHSLAVGAVIGKAMTGLDSGTGLVLVLVSLQ